MKQLDPNTSRDLSKITADAAFGWLADFAAQDAEAGALATEMIESGAARLGLVTSFGLNRAPSHRVLLAPVDGDGLAVEIAAVGCDPTRPTPEGLAARIWFFGQLAHWQPRH